MQTDGELKLENENSEDDWILFPVSLKKLILLSVATGHIYFVYWAYRNFKWIELKTGKKQLPKASGFFVLITLFSLVKKINLVGEEYGLDKKLMAPLLAALYFVLEICWRLPAPTNILNEFSIIPIIFIQIYINKINRKVNPNVSINDRIPVWQWIIIVLGWAFFGLMNLAMLLSPEEFN